MSVVGLDQILELVKLEESLLENLGERDLNNPEGVGFDLRLGSVHKIVEGGAYIEADGEAGLGKRKGVKTEELANFREGSKEQEDFIVKPGEYYLVQTIESVNTPSDLMPVVYTRSSLFRAGLLLLNSKTDPGYKGKLTMGLTNLSPFKVRLQMGARICNMVFFRIEGKTVSYRGQHQGGRVTPEKEEQQV
jgi:deoxycytidine triphosphate deaminase